MWSPTSGGATSACQQNGTERWVETGLDTKEQEELKQGGPSLQVDTAKVWALGHHYGRGDGKWKWWVNAWLPWLCETNLFLSQQHPDFLRKNLYDLWTRRRKGRRQVRISKGINITWCVCQDFNSKSTHKPLGISPLWGPPAPGCGHFQYF